MKRLIIVGLVVLVLIGAISAALVFDQQDPTARAISEPNITNESVPNISGSAPLSAGNIVRVDIAIG